MFDIGFWELCLIGVIALLVFGPEKLPSAARTAGFWVGRARRMITSVKQDIDRELYLQEMRDAIQQSDQNVHQLMEETKTGLNDLNKSINLDPTQSQLEEKPDSSTGNTATNTTNASLQTEQR